MAALAHGVPLLILPVEPTSDQPFVGRAVARSGAGLTLSRRSSTAAIRAALRSEEHTSELQSRGHLVCRLLLEKKKNRATFVIWNQQTNKTHRPECEAAGN